MPTIPPKTYLVTITFSDGIFRGRATSSSDFNAYQLVLQDARMGNVSSPQYHGKVIDWKAEDCAAAPVSAQPQAMPEGWKLVPVVPTNGMLREWFDAKRPDGSKDNVAMFGGAYAAMLAAAPPSPQPVAESVKLSPVEVEDGRMYIPLPGGWEVQTKGKGSTFRLCHKFGPGADDYRRWMVLDEKLHKPLEAMALAMRTPAAALQPVARQDEAGGVTPADVKEHIARIRRLIIEHGSMVHFHWPLAPMAVLERVMQAVEALATATAIEPVAGLTDAGIGSLRRYELLEEIGAYYEGTGNNARLNRLEYRFMRQSSTGNWVYFPDILESRLTGNAGDQKGGSKPDAEDASRADEDWFFSPND